MPRQQLRREPDYATACEWWTELPDIRTPIGWKDHLFRFNVLWNGTILAWPNLSRRTAAWAGQGVQLTFVPTNRAEGFTSVLPSFVRNDDGSILQGWTDSAAPVLWTEWSHGGLLLRQEIFAHVPGGGPVKTGTEPLFAWVRLSIRRPAGDLPVAPRYRFYIQLNAPFLNQEMDLRGHSFDPHISAYPRALDAVVAPLAKGQEFRLVEPDGKVRLAARLGAGSGVHYRHSAAEGHALYPFNHQALDALILTMSTASGAPVDMLIPMLPCAPDTLAGELALGWERARRETEKYWSQIPATAARVTVPEAPINETIRHSLRFAEVIAETDPQTGDVSMLSGSLRYADGLWTTPFSMAAIMLLDAMGYHATCEKYLPIFRKYQGTVCPPGKAFQRHPGYLATPERLTSINWLSDHGALLYTLSEHALLSGNEAFLHDYLPAIERACEFIRDARRLRGHGGVEGLMPAAVSTDMGDVGQAIWNDAWMFKGLTTAARLLARSGHARAGEWAAEARDYRRCFATAYRKACKSAPRWIDAAGKRRIVAPTVLQGDDPLLIWHPFYLDAGPLFLVYAGLLAADDPAMVDALDWFRNGPQVRFYRRCSDNFQPAVLDHEMSSCEPCYSWNMFHAHALHDRERYLECMYSLFAGSISRKTWISCETRGGITGTIFSSPPAIWLARLSVVDDQIEAGALHLLRLVPLAWLRTDVETGFEKMPTEFGPVSLRFRLSKDGRTLHVTYAAEFRVAPKRVLLHIPPLPALKTVVVNGRKMGVARHPVPLDVPAGLANIDVERAES